MKSGPWVKMKSSSSFSWYEPYRFSLPQGIDAAPKNIPLPIRSVKKFPAEKCASSSPGSSISPAYIRRAILDSYLVELEIAPHVRRYVPDGRLVPRLYLIEY